MILAFHSLTNLEHHILNAVLNDNDTLKRIIKFVENFLKKQSLDWYWSPSGYSKAIDILVAHRYLIKIKGTENFYEINKRYEKMIKRNVYDFYILNRMRT